MMLRRIFGGKVVLRESGVRMGVVCSFVCRLLGLTLVIQIGEFVFV